MDSACSNRCSRTVPDKPMVHLIFSDGKKGNSAERLEAESRQSSKGRFLNSEIIKKFLPLLLAALILALSPQAFAKRSKYIFDDVERIVAFGDIHGAYDPLVETLRGLELIDESGAWTGGKATGASGRPVPLLVQFLKSQG